jgi:hypothetical protein
MLFCGIVVFVTPAKLAIVVSSDKGPGDPVGLLSFGACTAVVLGLPGYLLFPAKRRFQAVGWLVFACMAYGLLMFGMITFTKMNPQMLSSPETRESVKSWTIHYDRLAALVCVELVVWAYLFPKKGD